jgi:hypothetical protein
VRSSVSTLESTLTTIGYEELHTTDAGAVLILTNATVTTAIDFLLPAVSLSSVQSSTPAADVTQHLQETSSTANRSSVVTTDSTPLTTVTSIFSPSVSVSPTHSVPDMVFLATVGTMSTARAMMPGHVTEGDGRAITERTTFADVNTIEQTVQASSVTPSSFFPPVSPWFFFIVTAFVFLSVFLAVIVVLLVRARSEHQLCWTKRQCYLPVYQPYQNGCSEYQVEPSLTAVKPAERAPLTSV